MAGFAEGAFEHAEIDKTGSLNSACERVQPESGLIVG